MRLAELALADYRDRRYHACVPVVLALLDGMVNDLEQHGFFSQAVNLSAWDSFAACSSGLDQLKSVLFRPRKKTTEKSIDLPYRNGILHGMDLGYDNRMVAAKSWPALFATADWARRIEQGKKEAPQPTPEASWREMLELLKGNADANASLEAWRPRNAEEFCAADHAVGSPEAALDEFLRAWQQKSYGVMAKRTHAFSDLSINARAGELRGYYQSVVLSDFTLEEVADTTPCMAEIVVLGSGTQRGNPFSGRGRFKLAYLGDDGMPIVHGLPGGTWFVNSWNPWHEHRYEAVETATQ